MFIPEKLGGHRFKDKLVLSAEAWIPKSLVGDPERFASAFVLSKSTFSGKDKNIQMVRVVGDHVIAPRYLMDWKSVYPAADVVAPTFSYEPVHLVDKMSPRDAAQMAAWEAFKTADNGILNLACGKGKTALAAKKIANEKVPTIIIVNNSGLIPQWEDALVTFAGATKEDIGYVWRQQSDWDKPLVIASIQTLISRIESITPEMRTRFGVVIFDEAHHLSADTFAQVAPLFIGKRYGLTATVERNDGLESLYLAHLGGVFFSDLEGDLKASVVFKELGTPQPTGITDRSGRLKIHALYESLRNSEERNSAMMAEFKAALDKGRKILVLSHSVELLQQLYDKMRVSERECGLVTGATPGPLRTKTIRDNKISFASIQVATEGLSVSELDTLFLITPFKSWPIMQQCVGRIERQHPGKKSPLAVVFEDVNCPPARAMCNALRRDLKRFNYSVTKVAFKKAGKLKGTNRNV